MQYPIYRPSLAAALPLPSGATSYAFFAHFAVAFLYPLGYIRRIGIDAVGRNAVFKNILTVTAAVVALASAVPAAADQWSTIDGQPIRIATVHTHLAEGDRATFDRIARELHRSVRISPKPLPYSTLQSIPDAREIGVGDCKTLSVAFRNILVAEHGFDRESLLLATLTLPSGVGHAVLLLNVVDNGRQRTLAYDSLRRAVVPIEELTRAGYRWEGRESYPDETGRLLNFNGRGLY